MRLLLTLTLLLALVGTGYATDSAWIDRDGVTTSLVLTPANLGAATAAQGAKADTAVQRGDLPEYWLSDYGNPNLGATLQAAIDDVAADGGGVLICDTPDNNDDIVLTSTLVPKSHVSVDVNTSTLKWSGVAGATMVENNSAAVGVIGFQLFNGYLDPGANVSKLFYLHSMHNSKIYDLTLVSANPDALVFMHLVPDAGLDSLDGTRNVVNNTFGPFYSETVTASPVALTALIMDGSNPPWRVTTGNDFVGPWEFAVKGSKGIIAKQYCDSNNFKGLFRITLANPTTPGTCVVFNDSADKTQPADVWGLHFEHLSCETWYPDLAGQKAVEINNAGGIIIDYLGNDRVTQGTWPVGMVTDNYSKGHKITYVEGAPNYLVKQYIKGDSFIQGTGNGITFPDGSKQTTAPNDTAYDATSWDGNTAAPTKNAVRDKVESILATAGTGNVTGPVSSTDNALAQYSGITGRTIKDGPTLATLIGTPGVDTKVPTEKAVRDALATVTPSQSVGTTDSPTFKGTTLNGSDWITGTGTVSSAQLATLTADTAGSFAAVRAGAAIKLSSGAILDVISVTDTSHVVLSSNPSTVSSLTWSYRNPTLTAQHNGTDYAYVRPRGVDIKGDGAGTYAAYEIHNWGGSASFRGSRANGTPASPSVVVANDVLMGLSAQGWAGSVWSNAGALQIKAGETWSASATGSYMSFNPVANGATTSTEKLRLYGDGGLQLGGTFGTSPGAGNLSVSGYIVDSFEDKTASYTVSKDTSRITLATGTATVTLPKALPAGTTSVLITVAGAAAAGVSFAAESGGSLSWGDAGAPTFTNSKTADVVCVSENATATTTAAWRCVKGGDF